MRTGVLLIGDELLLGKREDKHLGRMIALLSARSMRLSWARLVGDDAPLLEATLRDTFASGDLVFCFGGIGATPDDLTRQCAATAGGLALVRHPEATALIEARFGEAAYPYRILMADLPAGACLIPNPVNQIAGFSVADHHFLPGFPNMAWPMAEWVLDQRYRHLHAPGTWIERGLRVYGAPESSLIPLMHELLAEFPQIKIASLPSPERRGEIELGLSGDPAEVTAAHAKLVKGLDRLGVRRD